MAVWKNDQIAADVLSGRVNMPKTGIRNYGLLILAVCAVGLAFFALYGGKPNGLALVSRNVNVAPAPIADAPGVPARAARALPLIEEVELPPAELKARTADKKTASSAAGAVFISPDRFSPFDNVYAALSKGKGEAALAALKGVSGGSEHAREAKVLEARALLAMGKISEARERFESSASASADTELEADALFGSYLCQAGTLQRCRDNELEQVGSGADSWGAATAALEQARRMDALAGVDAAKQEAARKLYQQALDKGKLEDADEARCLERLQDLTNRLVLDSKAACAAPRSVFYKVEPGDSVEKIARKFKVNQGQIKRLNKLNDKLAVRYGQTLKMLEGDVVYKVDRSRLTGTLYIGGVFIRRYAVGVGPGAATPVGTYVVERKVVNPDWYYDGKRVAFGDPKNILGTRWMGFAESDNGGQTAGLGVHGTCVPESVPGRESKGCVRMINADVEELYDFMPQGGKVQIVE